MCPAGISMYRTAGHTGPALQGAKAAQGNQSHPPLRNGTSGTPSPTGVPAAEGYASGTYSSYRKVRPFSVMSSPRLSSLHCGSADRSGKNVSAPP